jgi:K+-transporting ATPase KdpF subunit
MVTAMLDLVFTGLTVAFFLAAAAYVAGCRRLQGGRAMNLEALSGLVISVLLLAYLVYAMLRPEKF